MLLPFGSIDETVRLDGTYVIDYDRTTATIYDVFYVNSADATLDRADAVYAIEHKDNRSDRVSYAFRSENRSRNNGKPLYVGYYGPATAH